MVLAVGFGTRSVDSFGVTPEERSTENYVSWKYRDTFRVLHESIFDAAEAEKLQAGGRVRPARVAVVIGKATDFNESRLLVDKAKDPFVGRCQNGPAARQTEAFLEPQLFALGGAVAARQAAAFHQQ